MWWWAVQTWARWSAPGNPWVRVDAREPAFRATLADAERRAVASTTAIFDAAPLPTVTTLHYWNGRVWVKYKTLVKRPPE